MADWIVHLSPEDAPYPVIDRQCVIRAPTVREWSKPEATLPYGRGSVSSVRNQGYSHPSRVRHVVCPTAGDTDAVTIAAVLSGPITHDEGPSTTRDGCRRPLRVPSWFL